MPNKGESDEPHDESRRASAPSNELKVYHQAWIMAMVLCALALGLTPLLLLAAVSRGLFWALRVMDWLCPLIFRFER